MTASRSSTPRRSVRVALAAVAFTTALAACSDAGNGGASPAPGGDSEQPAGDVSLTLTIVGGEADMATMQERLAAAKEVLPNVSVDVVQITEEYDTKLQTMFAGGTAPDVLQVGASVHAYSSKGQLEDLSAVFPDVTEQFSQGTIDTYSTDGKLWAAPDRIGSMALYYNKDLFDAAGVAYPDGTWDWDDFRDAAKKLTVREGDTVVQWGYGAGDWWPWPMSWMYQNGGGIFDESGAPAANSPQNIEALEFYNAMVFEDGSTLAPIDYANLGLNNGQPDPLFAQGKLAMGQTGFWNVGALMETDLNWGVAPIQRGDEIAVPGFGDALAVSSQSKHKDAATELVRFLTTTPEGQLPWITNALDVPANLKVVALDEAQNPAWNTQGVDLTAFTGSVEYIFLPPAIPEWNEIQTAFVDGLAAAWSGDGSISDGLDQVQASLERILG